MNQIKMTKLIYKIYKHLNLLKNLTFMINLIYKIFHIYTFSVVDDSLKEAGLSWNNCRAYSSDNANNMVGKHNSVLSRIAQQQPLVYAVGCPAHLAHLAAKKGTKPLSFNVEDFLIDIYYHFDKSAKRKAKLREFSQFCDTVVRKVLKHVSTRWLSIGKCVERILQMYTSLRSYFLSTYGQQVNN